MVCAHLAHTEIHLGELIERTDKPELKKLFMEKICQLRDMRSLEMIAIGKNVDVLWCNIKHLLLAYIHMHELGEKTGNTAYYDKSARIMLVIDELISREDVNAGTVKHCPRCDEKITEEHRL